MQLSPPPSRIAGYDLARAIALMGMVFVNYKYWWVNHFGRGPFEKAMRWVSK